MLAVVYLLFTEGYVATTGERLLRADLSAEAIRLGRLLTELMPYEPEVLGLLGLMVLQHARRDARLDEGSLVLLADQDRDRWRWDEIDEGIALTDRARRGGAPGPYVIQARIAAKHAATREADGTDWHGIAQLYADLEKITRSPVVRLNHAVAVAEAQDEAAGLALLEGLEERLPHNHRLPVARAHMLHRLGRHADAVREYDRALSLTDNRVEHDFLQRQRVRTDEAASHLGDA